MILIPKIIHRMRLSSDKLPEEAASYEQSWRHHHPEWELRLWTLDNLPSLRNRAIFDACDNIGHRADILRYELLEQFGGVYVDLDFECLRPLDDLFDGVRAFAGAIQPRHRDLGLQTIETAILGSVPHLPFFSQIVGDLPSWFDWFGWHRSVSVRTGPQYFEKQAQRWHAANGQPPLTFFKPEIFYPYLWDEPHRRHEKFPDSYAVHHWWGTWRRERLIGREACDGNLWTGRRPR